MIPVEVGYFNLLLLLLLCGGGGGGGGGGLVEHSAEIVYLTTQLVEYWS